MNLLKSKMKYFKVAIPFVGVLFLSLFLLFYYQNIKAESSVFYPSSCLGGWKNSQNASGEPDSFLGASPRYTDENSASIENAISNIFCGDFNGKIPENVSHKKISLHFSWGFEKVLKEDISTSLEIIEEEIDEEDLIEEEKQEEIEEEINFAEEDGSINVGTSVEEVTKVQIEEPSNEVQSSSLSTPEENPEVQNEPAPAVEVEQSEPFVSFLRKLFIKTAKAEELETETENVLNEEIENDYEDGAIFEVSYTTDGESWHSLGYVYDISNNISFEIPLASFENISILKQTQISLRSVNTLNSLPKIYLDSMWIKVEYEKKPKELKSSVQGTGVNLVEENDALTPSYDVDISEESLIEDGEIDESEEISDFDFEEYQEYLDSLPKLDAHKRILDFSLGIVLDEKATHSCELDNFHINLLDENNKERKIILKDKNYSNKSTYQLKILNIPEGFDIHFDINSLPTLTLNDLDDKKIIFKKKSNPQIGNFNIVVMFTKIDGKVSNTLCQVNLINI